MTETGIVRTYAAHSAGRRLTITTPNEIYSVDLPSDARAGTAVQYIRENGIECSQEAIERFIKNI